MISIFNLTLAANEAREVAITGEYFELRNALYPVALIELLDRSGGVISRLENPEQSDFVRPGRYETVRVTNGPTPQTIKHFYGTGDAGSRRTSGLVRIDGASDVSIIDGEKNRVIAGGMFCGTPFCVAPAGQYANTQLWNPVGSGKNIIVPSLDFGAGATASMTLFMTATQLASASTQVAANKRAGGAAPIALLRFESKVAVDPQVLGTLRNEFVVANVPLMWTPKGGLVVPPGYGLNVGANTVAQTITSNFEWLEELV